MKILIKNAYNSYNYGTMMMAENVITFFNYNLADNNVDYYFEETSIDNIERYKKATNYDKIFVDKKMKVKVYTEKIKFVRYFERKIKRFFSWISVAKFYDVIIVLGGDDFSEIYYNLPSDNHVIKNIFKELYTYSKYSKLFMIGQTIGPYTGKRIKWAKKYLKNINIYSRDEETKRYLKDELGKDIVSSKDLAFLDLKKQKEYNENINEFFVQHNLKKDQYITFVPTGFVDCYTKDENDMVDGIYELLKYLCEVKKEKVVFLCHVVTPNIVYNDYYFLDAINKKYDRYINKNCIVIKEHILPAKARSILGNGKYTITFRMHAAVSTFQMGKPAICLSYSKKFNGVIAEGLGCSKLVIDATKNDFFANYIIKDVGKCIDYIESNNLSTHISEKVKYCQTKVEETLKDIIKIIEEKR